MAPATLRMPMVVGSMVVWALWFVAIYALTGIGCRGGWQQQAVPAGNVLSAVLLLCTLIALVLMALCGVIGYRAWRAASGGAVAGRDATQRQRFMAMAMVVLSVISAIGTLLGTVPMLMLDPCAA
jgi:hypothetical protein